MKRFLVCLIITLTLCGCAHKDLKEVASESKCQITDISKQYSKTFSIKSAQILSKNNVSVEICEFKKSKDLKEYLALVKKNLRFKECDGIQKCKVDKKIYLVQSKGLVTIYANTSKEKESSTKRLMNEALESF